MPTSRVRSARKPSAPIHPKTSELYRFIGDRVRKVREELEMTQQELSDAVGFARTSITNLEIGKQHLPLHHLMSVAEALHIELVEFIPTREQLAGRPTVVRGVLMKGAPRTHKLAERLLKNSA